MAAVTRKAPVRPPAKAPGLGGDWHGLPVWAWTVGGAVLVAGGFLFYRRWKGASSAATTPATTYQITGQTPTTGTLPLQGTAQPLPVLPSESPGPTAAGSPGVTYTAPPVSLGQLPSPAAAAAGQFLFADPSLPGTVSLSPQVPSPFYAGNLGGGTGGAGGGTITLPPGLAFTGAGLTHSPGH